MKLIRQPQEMHAHRTQALHGLMSPRRPVWPHSFYTALKQPVVRMQMSIQREGTTTVQRHQEEDQHSSSPSASFSLSAAHLKGLVQEAFDNRGSFSCTADWFEEQLQTSSSRGLGYDTATGAPPDAEQRAQQYGRNSMPPPPSISFLQLIWDALQDRTLVLLIGAGFVSLGLSAANSNSTPQDWIEGAAILASVFIVVAVSSATNYHKESKFRALNTLKDDIQVRVIRGGVEQPCSTHDLLVGDLLVVETGDILSADGLLVMGDNIRVDESHMTGESDDIIKSVSTGKQLMLAGSKVLEGYGHMIVVAVGLNSQQGHLAQLVAGTQESALREDTLLMRKLQHLADLIGNVGVGVAGLVFGINSLVNTWHLLSGHIPAGALGAIQAYLDAFITGITILVVAVPEGLPLAVTLALAFSVQRMLKDNNLVRHLDACETMASATTICTDKTGTLTANDMTVVRLWSSGQMMRVRPSRADVFLAVSKRADGTRSLTRERVNGSLVSSADKRALVSLVSLSVDGADGEVLADVDPMGLKPQGRDDFYMADDDLDGYPPMQVQLPAQPATKATSATSEKTGQDAGFLEPLTSSTSGGRRATASTQQPHSGRKAGLLGSVQEVLLQNIMLNCTASIAVDQETGKLDKIGNRTECALLELGMRMQPEGASPDAWRQNTLLLQAFPFTSERKRMSALVVLPDKLASLRPHAPVPARLLTKGGAEVVLEKCAYQLDERGQVVPLTAAAKCEMLERFNEIGLRVLALAYRDVRLPSHVLASVPSKTDQSAKPSVTPGLQMPADTLEQDLVLICLLGLQDPLRPDVTHAIQQCQRAGIVVRMLTGDNARTAAVIARDCGILPEQHTLDEVLQSSQGVVHHLMARGTTSVAHTPVTPTLNNGHNGHKPRPASRSSDTSKDSSSSHSQDQPDWDSVDAAADPSMPRLCAKLRTFSSLDNEDLNQQDVSMSNPVAIHSISGPSSADSSLSSSSSSQDQASSTGPAGLSSPAALANASRLQAGSSGSSVTGSGSDLESEVARVDSLILEGPQFRQIVQRADGSMDLDALKLIWPRLRVIARCSPADKYTLVNGLKQLRAAAEASRSQGTATQDLGPREVIAMTGDGTNDAPALSAADVGFAMNSGTSIAKEAADILLMDNSFTSIVSAVKWGRNVFDSVTKFLQFQLTANVVAVITSASGALLLSHSPLSAVQMLYINLLMDSLASLALATESPTESLLDMPPVSLDQPLISRTVIKHILGQSLYQLTVLAALVLMGEEWFHVDLATKNTLVFNTFVCMQLFNQINCRKIRDEPHVLSGLLSHPMFCAIMAGEALMQVAIIQTGGSAFSTVPLSAQQWAACLGMGAATLLVRRALLQVNVEQTGLPLLAQPTKET